MTARLVLSAHLDDAVFSCWRAIARAGAGPVTVATVLAGTPRPGLRPPPWDEACGVVDPAEHMLRRRQEDRAALRGVGAEPVHLDFLDEQYRDGPAPERAIVEAIEELCQGHDEMWIPAGIGGNADHLLIAEAALAASGDIRRFLYADLPYTVAHGWRALVGAARTGRHDRCSLEAQLNDSAFIPPNAVPRLHQLSAAEQQAKVEAIRLYRSQLGPLVAEFGRWFEDPEVAGAELYWELGGSIRRRPVWELLEAALPARSKVGGEPDGHADTGPFLTVLTRTRGDRPQGLSEALQSLAAQTCEDFEVLVLCHDLGPAALDAVRAQVRSVPGCLAARIRILPVEGGGRAHPLNVGVVAAGGRYVAVLDDDDLALPDWVERFRLVAARHPGHIVRARMGFLRCDAGQWSVQYLFADDFDLVDHLVINESAICGLAYPRGCFTELGLSFDDSLPVVEDWDLLLRAAPLCGVASTSAITSLYRCWANGDDSHSRYTTVEWAAAERTVIDKADDRPLVMPPGSASTLRRDRLELTRLRQQLAALEAETSEQLRLLQADHEARTADLAAAHRAELDRVGRRVEEIVEEFRHSTSWRLTAPVRAIGGVFKRLPVDRGAMRAHPPAASATLPPAPAVQHPVSYSASYFEDLYRHDPDPWDYTTSWYERRKYAVTLASLPKERYRRVFEPGCSIGVLSESLAQRCDALVAADCAPTAVQQARARLGGHHHVEVERMQVPGAWPDGSFDLIVLSEFLYFLDKDDREALIARTISSLRDDGHIVAVHYLPAAKIPGSDDDVHDAFRRHPNLLTMVTHADEEFVLDVFARRPSK